MKKTLLTLFTLSLLGLTVHAQTQPIAPVTATSAQVTAQLTALGITLPADQSVATISRVTISASVTAPLATPIVVRVTFAPSTSGVVPEDSYPASVAQVTAALAAGPALSVTNPAMVMIFNWAGTFRELAR